MKMVKGRWIEMIWAWAVLVSCIVPLSAQEITESWVAEQLGGSRSVERPARQGEAASGRPQ